MLWLQKNPWPWWLQLQLCFTGCILSHSTKRLLLWIGELWLSWYCAFCIVMWPIQVPCILNRPFSGFENYLALKGGLLLTRGQFWWFGGVWCHRAPIGTQRKGTLWKWARVYWAPNPPMIFISLLERDEKSWLGSAGMETGGTNCLDMCWFSFWNKLWTLWFHIFGHIP